MQILYKFTVQDATLNDEFGKFDDQDAILKNKYATLNHEFGEFDVQDAILNDEISKYDV